MSAKQLQILIGLLGNSSIRGFAFAYVHSKLYVRFEDDEGGLNFDCYDVNGNCVSYVEIDFDIKVLKPNALRYSRVES